MERINYNQFFYFWVIAKEMSITRAAERLRTSQSNVSEQLLIFEEFIGQALFERRARKISLTEAGKMELDYADSIFSSGIEMMDLFRNLPVLKSKTAIRVGAISSLSKNLQIEFIRPLLKNQTLKLVMVEGELGSLLRQLQNHALDVLITNTPVRAETTPEVFNHKLGEMQVSLIGTRTFKKILKGFPKSLSGLPLYLPGRAGRYRSDFEAWMERERISPEIRAEVEDMALLRLFTLSGSGIALVPEIVVKRELASGELVVLKRLKGFTETMFAVTTTRKFPNPFIEKIVKEFAR